MKRTAVAPAATYRRGVAVLHLTLSGLRGTVGELVLTGGLPMRELSISPKKTVLGAVFAVLFGLFGLGQTAQAANPLELNFGLFGPRYDGGVKVSEKVLGTITAQFQEKESKFWNSSLQIKAYGPVSYTHLRAHETDSYLV